MEVKIKYKGGLPLGVARRKNSDWIDLRSAETVTLVAGQYYLLNLGVAMELPKGYEGIIAPRSSTFNKWGIILVNSIGIVDNSYCGNNDYWHLPILAFRKTTIYEGDRICQFRILQNQPEFDFKIVQELVGDDRGGIGSTGTR